MMTFSVVIQIPLQIQLPPRCEAAPEVQQAGKRRQRPHKLGRDEGLSEGQGIRIMTFVGENVRGGKISWRYLPFTARGSCELEVV